MQTTAEQGQPSCSMASCVLREHHTLFLLASLWEPHMCVCMLSCFSHVQLFVSLWTVAHQAPLSMGFSTQEYWSGLSFPPSGNLPDSGIEPVSLTSLALVGGFFITSTTWEALGSRIGIENITTLQRIWKLRSGRSGSLPQCQENCTHFVKLKKSKIKCWEGYGPVGPLLLDSS